MDNDGYILGDYLTNAHYDIEDMPAYDIFVGREEEQLPTIDAGNVALSMVSRMCTFFLAFEWIAGFLAVQNCRLSRIPS